MKKLLKISTLGLVTAAAVAASSAATAIAAVPATVPPFQGTAPLPLVLSVDTADSGSAATKLAETPASCAETSIIHFGQTIVFRMWGVDVKTGASLTEANVENEKGAYVIIPNMKVAGVPSTVRIPLVWGEHNKEKNPAGEANKHAYWTAGVPTKGTTAAAATPWQIESATGTLTPIAEKTAVELTPSDTAPVNFAIHVVTKSTVVTKVITKKTKKKNKKGKKITVIKKVTETVTEPGQEATYTQAGWPTSSQLLVVTP
jgi:hypothetical protein